MEKRNQQDRKHDHIQIAMHKDVKSSITNGFESYSFRHQALPEINFEKIDIQQTLFGKKLSSPLFISSMTGGTANAGQINRNLATAAQHCGIAMGVGSQRVMLENPSSIESFEIRKYAPSILLFANIGAVQLNYGVSLVDVNRLVDVIQADALIIHLNSMQEIFQLEGQVDFSNLLEKIEGIVKQVHVPVIIKEVGWGISGKTAAIFESIGVAAVDVAGAGGTSWSEVESYRLNDAMRVQSAGLFRDWGIPTAVCLEDVVSQTRKIKIFASGGLSNGVEAAKAIALGASLCGFARKILPAAIQSAETVERLFEELNFELRAAMFGAGAQSLQALTKGLLFRN
jgi:isopentenyl-diphosphate Delta-isomerase